MPKGYGTRRIGVEDGANARCDNPECRTPFYRTPALLKNKKFTFCSRDCYNAYMANNSMIARVIFDSNDVDCTPLQLRIRLTGVNQLQFEGIKKEWKLIKNTHVIKRLINQKYVEMFGEELSIDPTILTQAQKSLIEDFVNRHLLPLNNDPEMLGPLLKDELHWMNMKNEKFFKVAFQHAEAYLLEGRKE